MRSNTGFRRTQILVTKIIHLTIETGSLTGIYFLHPPLSQSERCLISAVVALATLILFIVFPYQTFYVTPAFAISKLYANTIYMVLNSRIQIMGGRNTYTSSTDMEITSTMMKDIISRSTQGAQRMPVVAITKEIFSSDDETGRMSVSHVDSRS